MAFTQSELEKLAEFRERVAQFYPECNEKLITWLRARDMDINKAEQMLRRHLIWRKHNEIEKLATWRSPKVFFPYLYLGADYEKAPVFLLPLGRWDFRSCIECGDIVPALRFVYQTLENVISTAHSQNIYQGLLILDFDGFGYRQLAHRTVIQGILEVVRVFEANFPELLKHAFIINAPKIFNILFTMIRPMLHSRTLAKVQIYNDDPTKWQDALFKVMPTNIVPTYWGGIRKGIDEFCSEAWYQEPLPQNYMRKLSTIYDEYGDEWFTIKVAAGEKLTFKYTVNTENVDDEESQKILKWSFYSDSYDIGFGIINETNGEILIANSRVNSHQQKQIGCIKLIRPGKYLLEFDNLYSRSRSKVVHYCIALISGAGGASTNGHGADAAAAVIDRSIPAKAADAASIVSEEDLNPVDFEDAIDDNNLPSLQERNNNNGWKVDQDDNGSSSSGNYSDPENNNNNNSNHNNEKKIRHKNRKETAEDNDNNVIVVRM